MPTIEAIGVAGARLDRLLADAAGELSRAYVRKLIDDGACTVNGREGKPGMRLNGGEQLVLEVPEPEDPTPRAQDIPFDVLYEDEDVIVVDKPAGLVVHPAAGHQDGTLVNALLAHVESLPGISGTRRPGIVHRLDKDTSGALAVAKTSRAETSLARQIRDHKMKKVYLALVDGHPDPPQGLVDAPIARDPRHRQKMAIVAGGREAQTEYRRIQDVGPYSLLECVLITGRTHQIRVHLRAIGYPVVGDPIYGRPAKGLDRQFLHAHVLGFSRPKDGRYIEAVSPLPEDLRVFLDQTLGA
jgi:23S rRNA pseudouridine1911/1915/1917 synthase